MGGCQTAFPRTRVVITEGESQHDGQPENGADDDQLGALGTVARMHEVENHQRGLDRGNGESDDNIIFAEVLESGPNGDAGAKHQGQENDSVNSWRNDVLGHAILSQTLLAVPVNQIQQREQIDPHNIDKVPVQTHDFNGGVVLRREAAAERIPDEPNEQACTNDHVQGVQAGHSKVQREVELAMRIDVWVLRESLIHFLLLQGQFLKVIAGHGMRRMVLHVKAEAGDEMVVEFLLVFDGLDAKKDGAKTKRGDQENTDQFLLPDLRGPDGHGHGQTAHNQHNGVAGAQHDVKGIAANAKSGAECMAVYGVGQKEAAEEQDFGDQEDPHAERSGFLLLLEGLKLSVQLSGAMHAVLLFLSQSLAWPRRRTEDGLKAVPTAENTERLIISLSRRERLCARRQSKIRPVLVVVRLPSNFRRDMEIFRGRR